LSIIYIITENLSFPFFFISLIGRIFKNKFKLEIHFADDRKKKGKLTYNLSLKKPNKAFVRLKEVLHKKGYPKDMCVS
jgi:hypothetical protein